jgi:succinate dehydrogenase/fumarate reductase flavoprotein subunit
LIIGFGRAGSIVAVAAHDSATRVLVNEKMGRGAGNLGECLAFGRIAGREAAKEPLSDY